ncbi:chemotaxis protein CheA [Eubacterium limosum]|uniref:chemotaxis protein CheA n=1 Tax=Eubacterium limosum TaxID=1736 RepID=UPI001063CC2D|nr:ATP-binding protein [Eubacterium limosum]
MSFFEADVQAMLEVYLLETSQLMEKLDEILLQSEASRELTAEDINSIFRIMHTTKSSSAIMGLDSLQATAHRLEDLFSELRDDPGQMKKAEEEIFELLFDASDFIKAELKRMTREDYTPENADDFERRIKDCLEQIKTREQTKSSQPEESLSTFLKKPGVIVKVTFEQGCKMENVRAFMLMKQLSAACPGTECFPDSPEKHPESAGFIRESGMLFCVAEETLEKALPIMQRGLFVSQCELLAKNPLQSPEAPQEVSIPEPEALDKKEAVYVAVEKVESEFLNVRTDRLNHVQNLLGELMLFVSSLTSRLETMHCGDDVEKLTLQTSQVLEELEDMVIHMRMVPVERIVPKLRRVLRDVAKSENKAVNLTITGQDVEADNNIIDQLLEASMHIMRNAVDHGIETPEEREKAGKSREGDIRLAVESHGGELIARISDDGRGMDVEKLRQRAREKHLFTKPEEAYTTEEIFELSTLPGLSTNQEANAYSGRGVGMDIVKKITDEAGGHLRIESEKGQGTAVILNLPLTHTIVECLRFSAGTQMFSLPAHQVQRYFEYTEKNPDIHVQNGEEVIIYEGKALPIIDLTRHYGLEKSERPERIIIHVRGPVRETCIRAGLVMQREKIVLKPLPALFGEHFKEQTAMNGCSVMGDGQICMALDIETLIRRVGKAVGRKEGEEYGRPE